MAENQKAVRLDRKVEDALMKRVSKEGIVALFKHLGVSDKIIKKANTIVLKELAREEVRARKERMRRRLLLSPDEQTRLDTKLLNLAWSGITPCMEMIEYGADVNARDGKGLTSLLIAATRGHTDLVKYFIDMGAGVNAKDDKGYTSLHYAAENDNTESLKCLIKKGVDIEAKDNDGETPLHKAAGHGSLESLKYLIAKGANPIAAAANGLKATDVITDPKIRKVLLDAMTKNRE